MADTVRIDKFLWAVRLYKTRSIASEAVKRGKVSMDGTQVKSSRNIKVGDTISIKVPAAVRSFQVLKLAQNRMGAKLVPDHIAEVTPKEQMELIELHRLSMQMQRQRGMGRPTKKERRDLDSYFDANSCDDDFDILFGDEEEEIN